MNFNLQNRGAIGVIGSTRDSDMGSFGFLDGKILDEEINDSTHIIGEAFMESKLSYTYIKYKRQYNLYGDPALNLWPQSGGNKILTSNLDSTSNLNPKKYILFNNYPNPFNPSTTIKYNLPNASSVEITIYDIIGNMIRDFTISYQTAGQHSILWNGTNRNNEQVASGIYLYHFNAVSLADKNNKFEKTAKMILMK